MATNYLKHGYRLVPTTKHSKNERVIKAQASNEVDRIERTSSYASKKAAQIAMAQLRRNGWFVHLYIPHSHTIKAVKDVTKFRERNR